MNTARRILIELQILETPYFVGNTNFLWVDHIYGTTLTPKRTATERICGTCSESSRPTEISRRSEYSIHKIHFRNNKPQGLLTFHPHFTLRSDTFI